jgi:hypothetical protein
MKSHKILMNEETGDSHPKQDEEAQNFGRQFTCC